MFRSKERVEFLSDIIVTAIESGGINYWADSKNYCPNYCDDKREYLPGGPKVDIREYESSKEDGTRPWHKLDIEAVAKGLTKVVKGGHCAQRYTEFVKEANRDNEGALIDSELADIIVQAGVLGEVIYG